MNERERSAALDWLRSRYDTMRPLVSDATSITVLAHDPLREMDVVMRICDTPEAAGADPQKPPYGEESGEPPPFLPGVLRRHAVHQLPQGGVAVVMQLGDAAALAEVLRGPGPIPVDRAAQGLRELAELLTRLDERGISFPGGTQGGDPERVVQPGPVAGVVVDPGAPAFHPAVAGERWELYCLAVLASEMLARRGAGPGRLEKSEDVRPLPASVGGGVAAAVPASRSVERVPPPQTGFALARVPERDVELELRAGRVLTVPPRAKPGRLAGGARRRYLVGFGLAIVVAAVVATLLQSSPLASPVSARDESVPATPVVVPRPQAAEVARPAPPVRRPAARPAARVVPAAAEMAPVVDDRPTEAVPEQPTPPDVSPARPAVQRVATREPQPASRGVATARLPGSPVLLGVPTARATPPDATALPVADGTSEVSAPLLGP
jgi:hypothetical protein